MGYLLHGVNKKMPCGKTQGIFLLGGNMKLLKIGGIRTINACGGEKSFL